MRLPGAIPETERAFVVPTLEIFAEIGGIINFVDARGCGLELAGIEFLSGKLALGAVGVLRYAGSPALTGIAGIIT